MRRLTPFDALSYGVLVAGGPGHLLVAALLSGSLLACSSGTANDAPSATVAAGSSRNGNGTTTTVAPATTTTTALVAAEAPAGSVERDVEDAYLRSWDVYTDAMLRLDPSRLDEVYSGEALDVRTNEIADLAARNTPAVMRVRHDYEIVMVNADDALVLENYLNHSVLVDGTTMQPIEPDPNKVVKREYVLRRERDGWRVAHINVGS
jgi:hypothetical protein